MPVSLTDLKPGDTVYDVSREKFGNTALRRTVVRPVYIKEVDVEDEKVFASWDGNQARWFRSSNGRFHWRQKSPFVF